MSAFDIAGAIVWTPAAALFAVMLVNAGTNAQGKVFCLCALIAAGLGAVFCIARLFGAHE